MEQAMIGPSPNPLILSYLKYAISSQVYKSHKMLIFVTFIFYINYVYMLQMVSYSSVLAAISKVTQL